MKKDKSVETPNKKKKKKKSGLQTKSTFQSSVQMQASEVI